jgi:hypothetical protein
MKVYGNHALRTSESERLITRKMKVKKNGIYSLFVVR